MGGGSPRKIMINSASKHAHAYIYATERFIGRGQKIFCYSCLDRTGRCTNAPIPLYQPLALLFYHLIILNQNHGQGKEILQGNIPHDELHYNHSTGFLKIISKYSRKKSLLSHIQHGPIATLIFSLYRSHGFPRLHLKILISSPSSVSLVLFSLAPHYTSEQYNSQNT